MSADIPDTDNPSFYVRGKTLISKQTLAEIDKHYNGGLTAWKARNKAALETHKSVKEHFHIAVTQLFETYKKRHNDALPFLGRLIACKSSRPCGQVICPACRTAKQKEAAAKAAKHFSDYNQSDLRFMTLLVRVVPDPSDVADQIKPLRIKLQNALKNNRAGLGLSSNPLKILGAFEVDLKNLGTQWDMSIENRKMLKQLGFTTDRKTNKPQYLVHLHAIVGHIDDDRKEKLREIIAKALGQETLIPNQLRFSSLHSTRDKSKNLDTLAHYMYKMRLQLADNIRETDRMEKRKKYHTPITGKALVAYLQAMQNSANFKGLKFEFGL